ncbi:single-stranded DNA-binding protein [Embleya sp. NPDC005971]|uniref:single-stranded DNA-binding protein n=1 Tax=Embleya sp. NPDC005971 TaxID=3156724 RepID=UPI0033C4AD2D
MNNTPITIIGNLTKDPEIRFTPTGDAVARIDVAVTPRYFDKTTNTWVDGETAFWPVTVWRTQAEHVAESLEKGMRVIVTGTVKADRWKSPEGEERYRLAITADEVGPSLMWATATVAKATRAALNTPPDDPWATATKTPPTGAGSDRPANRSTDKAGPPRKSTPSKATAGKSTSKPRAAESAGAGQSDEPPF